MEDASAAMLFASLKDHKEMEPIRMLMLNKTRLVRKAISDEGFDVGSVMLSKDSMCKPINIFITNRIDSAVQAKIMEGLKCLKIHQLDYNLQAPDVSFVGK